MDTVFFKKKENSTHIMKLKYLSNLEIRLSFEIKLNKPKMNEYLLAEIILKVKLSPSSNLIKDHVK